MLSEYVIAAGITWVIWSGEVAEWFARNLDRGESFSACVYRQRDDGTLIAGVFEHRRN